MGTSQLPPTTTTLSCTSALPLPRPCHFRNAFPASKGSNVRRQRCEQAGVGPCSLENWLWTANDQNVWETLVGTKTGKVAQFYEMLKYLHSFYFNPGEILWICLKWEEESRELPFPEETMSVHATGISVRTPRCCDRVGFHSNVRRVTESTQPQATPNGQGAPTTWGPGLLVSFALSRAKCSEHVKSMLPGPWVRPAASTCPSLPSRMQHEGSRGGRGSPPAQQEASRELRAPGSTEEATTRFGLESDCSHYLVIS